MTKAELIETIKRQTPIGQKFTTADVEAMLKTLDRIVVRELVLGGCVPLPGIGMLEVKTRKARKGRNPRTGAAITIPACKVVRLRVAGSLKNAVNQ